MTHFRLLLLGFFLIFFLFCPALAADFVELKPHYREIVLTGFTKAQNEMTVSSEVSGRCESVLVEEGEELKSPGAVAQIDSSFIRLDLEKNRIGQEEIIRQLELNDKTVARYTNLTKKQSVPVTNLEDAALEADKNRIILKRLKSEEKRLHELYDRHTLYGPKGWQVVERLVEPGEYVSQGQPVLRLGDYRKLLVTFLLTYEELQLLEGQKEIKLYSRDLQTEIEAKIFRISPGFDDSSKKIGVDVLITRNHKEFSLQLRSGLHVQLKIEVKERAAFVAPYEALISRYESYWLLLPSKKRVKVILLGTRNNGKEAIVSGTELMAGQLYLASPELIDSGQLETGQ